MSDTVQVHFDSRATSYDDYRRALIPNFDEFYNIGVDTLICPKSDPCVLDLGAGTGLSTAALLKRFPAAHVTLLDFSEEMLAVARERFKSNPNINFAIGDYRTFLPEERFNIVISGLSIHHLGFEEKQQLAIRVFNILTPEGEFVNSDMTRCENDLHEREMQKRFDAFVRNNLGEEMLVKVKDSQSLDIPITVAEQFDLLRNAGFRIIDCLYRYWAYGVFYGRK